MPATRSLTLDETRLCWKLHQQFRRNYDDDVVLHAIQQRCPHPQLTYHRRCVDCAAAIDKNGKIIPED